MINIGILKLLSLISPFIHSLKIISKEFTSLKKLANTFSKVTREDHYAKDKYLIPII